MTDITIDDTHILMPDLISGAGETPEDGACVMQAAAWLGSDGAWTDMPDCVHPVLRRVAIWVNDTVGSQPRQQLWPLIPRLIGTGRTAPAPIPAGRWEAFRELLTA